MMLCSLVMVGLMPSWALAADGWSADNATTADQLTGGTNLDLALCITWDTASVGEAETCDDAVANITPYDFGNLRNGVDIYDLSAVGGNRSCKGASEITIIAQKKSFPDVPTSGAWYSDVVYKAVAAGIFRGHDNGNFWTQQLYEPCAVSSGFVELLWQSGTCWHCYSRRHRGRQILSLRWFVWAGGSEPRGRRRPFPMPPSPWTGAPVVEKGQ